jgi:hypothetical protein
LENALAHWYGPVEERDDRVGKDVVAITSHHVSGVLDVDILGMGALFEETLGPPLTQHIRQTSPHEQGWQVEMIRALVEPLPVATPEGSVMSASRIPVPVVFTIGTEADVLGQPV